MNVKKPLLIAGVLASVGVAGIGATGAVSAATSGTNNTTNPDYSLVDKIASTFNLDKTKVQAVFDQEHKDREAEQQSNVEQKLTDLVKAGKLTEAQKSAILSKRAELQQKREADRSTDSNKTREQRKSDMDAERTSLDQWASQNKIDKQYLRFVMGGPGGHGGPQRDIGAGDHQPDATNNSTSNTN